MTSSNGDTVPSGPIKQTKNQDRKQQAKRVEEEKGGGEEEERREGGASGGCGSELADQ